MPVTTMSLILNPINETLKRDESCSNKGEEYIDWYIKQPYGLLIYLVEYSELNCSTKEFNCNELLTILEYTIKHRIEMQLL